MNELMSIKYVYNGDVVDHSNYSLESYLMGNQAIIIILCVYTLFD